MTIPSRRHLKGDRLAINCEFRHVEEEVEVEGEAEEEAETEQSSTYTAGQGSTDLLLPLSTPPWLPNTQLWRGCYFFSCMVNVG